MTHYILIDAETRKPVPLPFECRIVNGVSVRVETVTEPYPTRPYGVVSVLHNEGCFKGRRTNYNPSTCGLELITESAFMESQS